MLKRIACIFVTLLFLASSTYSFQDAKPKAVPAGKPSLPNNVKADLRKLIKELFEAKGHEAKAAVLEKIEQTEAPFLVTKADIEDMKKSALAMVRNGPVHAGGTNGRVKLNHPDYSGEYIINAAGANGKCALFIGLHGGGQGVGDAGQIFGLFGGGMGGGVINVFPTVIQKDATAWNLEREEHYVLELIECMKRSFSIDTNRIYLAGHSMGGYGTWSIGGRHADLFAAISPQAGGIFVFGKNQGGKTEIAPGCAANLKSTPIWFYHGSNDRQVGPEPDRRAAEVLKELKDKYGAYDFVWKEYPNIGHGLPPDGVKPIFQWMQTKTRNPYPKMVIWEPSRPYKKLFWWLKLKSVAGGFRDGRIVVRIENGNKFVVERGAAGLEIYLNEKMGISLAKELVVVDEEGKELYKGKPDYSISTLAESIEAKRDPEMFFYARITLR